MTNKCTMFDNLNMSVEHNDKNGNNQTVKGLKINNIYGEYIDDNQECKQFWVDFTYKGYEFSRCIDLNSVERELKPVSACPIARLIVGSSLVSTATSL